MLQCKNYGWRCKLITCLEITKWNLVRDGQVITPGCHLGFFLRLLVLFLCFALFCQIFVSIVGLEIDTQCCAKEPRHITCHMLVLRYTSTCEPQTLARNHTLTSAMHNKPSSYSSSRLWPCSRWLKVFIGKPYRISRGLRKGLGTDSISIGR